MTKPRLPLTAYRALTRIADRIGWDGCASVISKTEWTIRKYADPDTEREISLQDAMRLDLAYRRAGGEGAPLFETYAARLELDLAPALPDDDLFVTSGRAARESGEALDHTLHYATGQGDHARALREVSEAIEAWTAILHKLNRLKAGHGQ